MKLSIVMPALNEAATIEAALDALSPLRARGAEVIVVDGGSADGTRGSNVLLFLHADTRLPENADALVLQGLARTDRVWGRFDVRFDQGGLLRFVALMMNWRSRATGIATGDQALFVTRAAFERAGRFPPIVLMEDVALSARLKRVTRPLCLGARVTTSGRRWRKQGTLRTILLMWRLRLRFFLGADPAHLVRDYGHAP
ncbi:MAG: glycosyltransferase family 2 protein [Pseudolabrys sp.]